MSTLNLVAGGITVAATLITAVIFGLGLKKMLQVIRVGQPAYGRTGWSGQRFKNMLIETMGHTRMLQWHWVGLLHWFVYFSFLILSTAVLTGYFQVWDPTAVLPIIGHFFLFEWVSELIAWLGFIGIIALSVIRQMNHPRSQGRQSRFFGSRFWQAYFIEAMVALECGAGILVRGAEHELLRQQGSDYASALHFPLTAWVGDLFFSGVSEGGIETAITIIALVKVLSACGFLIIIGTNLTMGVAWHRFSAWFNIYFKREADGSTALGALAPLYVGGAPLDLETMEDLPEEEFEKLGVGKIEDFSWKGLLDFTTCTECGRCQSQCPAWNTEKPLSPKLLMMGLREHAYAKVPLLDKDPESLTEDEKRELERPLIGTEDLFGVIDPDVLWSCTNCGACVQQCPVDIEHVDHIDDMRRFQVLVESNFPAELNNIFKGLERKGNPWGMNPRDRTKWTEDLDFEVKQVGVDVESLDEVDWLFWVGCAGAFEDRAKKTTQAVAELLNIAGIDFAVLGDGETCTGDPARRAGNEIVFKQLAMENAAVFEEMKVKKVVSTCAHCFNTLKNEYTEFGLELEVVHHTQLLNRLVREGKLTPVAAPAGEEQKVTYHDPCFLGRHNQVYTPPRELIGATGATYAEMPRANERSFCCGAGGARMWMEETLGSRINVNRTDEAIATGAEKIAVGCPFCRVMLSDGLTMRQSEDESLARVEVLDVAQLLLASVKRGQGEPVEPTAEDEAAVVEEAEAATAAAAGVVASEELDEPASEDVTPETDAAIAAEHNVEVDDSGKAPFSNEPEAADEQPAEQPASEDQSGEADEPEAAAESHVESGVDEDAAEATVEPAEEPVEEPVVEPAEETADDSAEADVTESEAPAAEATTADAEPDASADDSAAEAPEPTMSTEPADGTITPVEDAPAPDPVSDDVAPLSDANPSGADLSSAATEAASADEVEETDSKGEGDESTS